MPGLILAGAGAGLTQAPLFAAASSLPANRATTGSGVLNMARQTGSALGVAMLVALLATAHPNELASYHHGWWFLIAATLAAARRQRLLRARRDRHGESACARGLSTRRRCPSGEARSPFQQGTHKRTVTVPGIDRATTIAFAQEGARVVVSGRAIDIAMRVACAPQLRSLHRSQASSRFLLHGPSGSGQSDA